MPQMETPEGIRIRYAESGPPDARPLVLAHGFTVSLEMWMPQRRALSEHYRLITWDARGHGGSSAPAGTEQYTMSALARDLRALLEALDAAEGAVVGGMSFGGQIAQQYAVDYPDELYALVLSDTTTLGPGRPPRPTPQVPEVWGAPGLDGGMHAMRTREDLTLALGSLSVPTLVIVGELDEVILIGLDRMIEALALRRVTRLAGCWHGTSSQRPDAWSQAVLQFLDDVAAGQSLGEDRLL